MFKEAASSGKRELVLRRDAVTEQVAVAIEGDGDDSLFAVTSLNNLQLNGFRGVAQLSRVGALTSLLQLSLPGNQLEVLPEEVGSLLKLKLLDLSQNSLSSLPPSLFLLPSLHSLLLPSNSLTDSSFPEDLPGEVLPALHQLDLSGNKLTLLPPFLSLTPQLAELRVARNSLSSLAPAIIANLAGLRVVEAQQNQLPALPHELANCSKLRSLQLQANPLKDRRLLKLVEQHGTHKPKAVLDYLASRGPQLPQEGKKKKKGKKMAAVVAERGSEDSDVEFSVPRVTVVRGELGEEVRVIATDSARRVRPYLVCTVIRGVSLREEDDMRQFLSLQSKLHDTICKRRRSATIATHDLTKIYTPVTYLAATATEVTMTPLGWSRKVKVQEFLDRVEANKPGSGGRKAKGVDISAAALFKLALSLSLSLYCTIIECVCVCVCCRYLQYVNREDMVYLKDSSGTVISLPPLTNSENTKVCPHLSHPHLSHPHLSHFCRCLS